MKIGINALEVLASEGDESASYILECIETIGYDSNDVTVTEENGEYVLRDLDGARIS